MSVAYGKLYGLGIGPGDSDLLTLRAARVLGEVDVVFAAASTRNDYSLALRIAAPHLKADIRVERLSFPMTKNQSALHAAWEKNADQVETVLAAGKDAAFLTLGDPMTYSTFIYLLRALKARGAASRVEVVPGVTSYHAAAAKAQTPLAEAGQSLAVISGTTDKAALTKALAAVDNAVILKAYRNFRDIRQTLEELGLAGDAVFVTRLGLEGELIVTGLDKAPESPHYFSLILVRK